MNQSICITAGEQSENHVGMEINGNGLCKNGFTLEDLLKFKENLFNKGIESEYYRLDDALHDDTVPCSYYPTVVAARTRQVRKL